MHRTLRPLAYGALGAVVLIAALAAPAAWATPGQSVLRQTVPTMTPKPAPVEPTQAPPSNQPTAQPPSTAQPPAVATLQPAAPTPASACPSNSALTLVADRNAVWPGATVVFTATLLNRGQQPLRDLVLESQLDEGLEPLAVISGNAAWQGQRVRTTAPRLAPGARLAVVYSARVSAVQPGKPLVARTNATSAGCAAKTASLLLGPPPSELPATGGSIR